MTVIMQKIEAPLVMREIEILVLNYNGEDLLRECLPSVVEASKNSSCPCSVTVVDNGSCDGSLEYLAKNFKNVKIFKASKNNVLCSYNEVLSGMSNDFVILLNNDVKVEKNFVDPLVNMIQRHSDALLVGSKILSFDKTIYEGARSKPFLRMGIFTAISRYAGHEKDMDLPGLTAQSAFGLFDRNKFLKLGGFDELYLPGIMEEADLCYRAYKMGYRCYYQPLSLIYHKGQVTFKKYYGKKQALAIAHRNSFMFVWKNITDSAFLINHFLFLPLKLISSLLRFKTEIAIGFFQAIFKLPEVIKKRRNVKRYFIKTDKEVFGEINRNLVSEQ